MMRPPCDSTKTRQRGIAATEFVIVLPVILLLMLGTAELGRAFYQYNTLTKAVRDGARYLADNAIKGATGVIDIDAATEAETKNLVVYGNTTASGSPLLEGWSPAEVTAAGFDAAHVRVSATFAFKPMFSRIPAFGLGEDIVLELNFQAATTMRAL
ncbi:TadE/TadG family type IV pilus assembly protein [Nitrosococcus wardiae]|uniref:Pilus assembly protein n=1 Tax=Nitrosococcus wardiae TaxID=1814290 RepID=A0A4P7C4L4_9GAMM|nr:TadE/TadG family type IV pilus assembly protein [Nitrosococcus wardiae]QBQ55876.1 pilus assembly protein [Nitrosococcus wardiae]